MSLSLAIAQIQCPSWWHENDRDQSKGRPPTPETIAKRQEILDWLRQRGGKVEGIVVQRQFGLSNSRLWHFVNPMIEAGQVRKYKPRHDKSLLEAL